MAIVKRPDQARGFVLLHRRWVAERSFAWLTKFLKTDARNARSRAAMEALPAQFEGIHRRHMKIPDGWRDTAWYSVIAPEWPAVRTALRRRLADHGVIAYTKR